MVAKVRRRRASELHKRRGRASDTPWKYRKLLTCAGDKLSGRHRQRLQEILAQDVELAVALAWGSRSMWGRSWPLGKRPRSSAPGSDSRPP